MTKLLSAIAYQFWLWLRSPNPMWQGVSKRSNDLTRTLTLIYLPRNAGGATADAAALVVQVRLGGWAAGVRASQKRRGPLCHPLRHPLQHPLRGVSEESPRSLRWVSGGSPVGRRTALAALTLRVFGDLFMYYDFIVRQRLAAGDGRASS